MTDLSNLKELSERIIPELRSMISDYPDITKISMAVFDDGHVNVDMTAEGRFLTVCSLGNNPGKSYFTRYDTTGPEWKRVVEFATVTRTKNPPSADET